RTPAHHLDRPPPLDGERGPAAGRRPPRPGVRRLPRGGPSGPVRGHHRADDGGLLDRPRAQLRRTRPPRLGDTGDQPPPRRHARRERPRGPPRPPPPPPLPPPHPPP